MEPTTIPGVLAEAARVAPGAEALVCGPARLTFAQLDDEVRGVARGLLASGVRPGDRVAVWAPNGERWALAALGAVSVGGVLVPVNTRFKSEEAGHVLGTSGASVLLVDDGFLGGGRLASLPTLPDLRRTVRLDDDAEWQALLDAGSAVPAKAAEDAARAVSADDLSDIVFTSGTTGRPKGVMATHGQSVRVFRCWADTVGLREGDRMLVVSPFFHTFGYKAGLLACLLRRATVLPVPVLDVPEVLALVARERVSVVPGAPTLYASFLQHPGHRMDSVRLAVTGASVVPQELIARMRAELGIASVVTAYGLTECTGFATGCREGDPDDVVSATSGRAIEGVEVRIADAHRPGEPGEVLVRGYNVMRGYWQDPAGTRAAVDADGWLHTGDVGVLDEAGNLTITDRLKDMFIVGGFNAYPAEIEQVLVRHPAVSEAAVVGVPDERLGEVGRAHVVLRASRTATGAELTAWCRERLANYKVPRSVVFGATLPRNATGKVDKAQLRGMA